VEDANAALVRLLIDGEPLDEALARRLCGDDGVDALVTLGALERGADGALVATVLLAPLDGVWIASDRPGHPGETRPMARDVVFTAHNDLTKEFLGVIPAAPGARVMELCAGTGVAALLAARHGAREAWATDIGARSTHFARFNARLSDLPQVRCEVSDVWSAAEGETFDLVTAHPPYVPAFANEVEYRDAGADGEEVTARIVAGLPAHLRDGGRASFTCVLTDRRDERIEARLRRWLGEAAAEFDIAVMLRRDFDQVVAYRSATRGGQGWPDAERWLRHFDALGIERFHLCSVELQRVARGRAPVTVRRPASAAVDAAAIDWTLRWARHAAEHPTPEARLAGRRPRVVPGTEVDVKLRGDGEGWSTVATAVMTSYPVRETATLPAIAPTLLELCDGTRDAAGLLAELRARGLVDAGVTVAHMHGLLDVLFSAGALEADDLPVPRRQAASTATSSSPAQSTRP
jgi:methylase of polypeptide subunit release factors